MDGLALEVLEANRRLGASGLVTQTWGNVSAIDRARGVVVIKPSGVPFEELECASMVTLSLDGRRVAGTLRPSSDARTHLELYRCFPQVGAIVHTHSVMASAWAQAGRPIPVLGTTHADCFAGDIACTRPLTPAELGESYERDTGRVIVETVGRRDPLQVPAVLVHGHGPFAWGVDVGAAEATAQALEVVARMAAATLWLNPAAGDLDSTLARRHFLRKHGAGAYYGQADPRAGTAG
jgi:L-ribulose-5-phosphate 4-epimerase